MTEHLDPGIVQTVAFLTAHGFGTCDSGDGRTKVPTMECALPYANVFITVDPFLGVSEADRLRDVLRSVGVVVTPISPDATPQIQLTYDPANETAMIALTYVDDAVLAAAGAKA